MKKLIIAASMMAFTVAYVSAQTSTPVVDQKQQNQNARIDQGVKSGELTHKEAAHLNAREAKIQHDKRVAKADGKVTPAEKAKLHREQKRTSHAIVKEKHDEQHK